jgi:hypothetical protein
MAVNESGKWLHLTPDGQVTDQMPPPDGSTVLAAPGGQVPADIVAKHKLNDHLSGDQASPSRATAVDGEPLVMIDDRAHAASIVAPEFRPEGHVSPRNQSMDERIRAAMANQAKAAEDEEDVEEDDPDEPGKKRTVRRKKSASKSHSHSHGHAHTKAVHKSDTEDK